MKGRTFLVKSATVLAGVPFSLAAIAGATPSQKRQREPATGPLRVHPRNPHYFTNGSGKAVYPTGSQPRFDRR